VVGIIGVETFYGQHTGNFRTLDALSTLTFDFPEEHPRAKERQAFFSKELAHFLVLAHQEKLKPASIKGSYAGALGLPQFMPSSWAKFAIDFDGDKHIDLFANKADVIGSVANYFKAFQWQAGMATHYPVQFDAAKLDMDALMAPDILPTFSVNNFLAKGAVLEGAALSHSGPLALIELLNGDAAPSYVAGTENFYAITRYNWSSYYAMAVIELGQAVADRIKN
jgi:membrane-bound lytic murein transglycosylase B